MKKSKFTEEEIAFALKQAEIGTQDDEVCRKTEISDTTFYNWRKKYGGSGARGRRAAEATRRREREVVAPGFGPVA